MKPPNKKTNDDPLLELIPEESLSSEQKKYTTTKKGKNIPLYKLMRAPTCFSELSDWTKSRTIWRDNGTVICLGAHKKWKERNVCFRIYSVDILNGAIYGTTDAAIADTATFFWSLPHDGDARLEIYGKLSKFDVRSIQPELLVRILDNNPTSELRCGIWSAEQSVVLATRPYLMDLKLTQGFAFMDAGTAFVDALENRTLPFGAFRIDFDDVDEPFGRENWIRLLKLNVFETLATSVLSEECALLPLSAKADVLDYVLHGKHIQPEDLDSLDIVAKDLTLRLYLDDTDWDDLLISLLDRMAELGHFTRLCLSMDFWDWGFLDAFDFYQLAPVAEALVGAICANSQLSHLDLSDTNCLFDWAPHLKDIFEAMEEHEGLRTFIVRDFPGESRSYYTEDDDSECHPAYSWLEQLLLHNRNITVFDSSHKRCSNGVKIDMIYKLNHVLNGSPMLVNEPPSRRPMLVATALVDSASESFQLTALLLSNHTDTLCELTHSLDVDNGMAAMPAMHGTSSTGSVAESSCKSNGRSKRKTQSQVSHVATKVARTQT